MTVTIHCTLKQIDYICIIITINMPTRNYWQSYTIRFFDEDIIGN